MAMFARLKSDTHKMLRTPIHSLRLPFSIQTRILGVISTRRAKSFSAAKMGTCSSGKRIANESTSCPGPSESRRFAILIALHQ